MTDCSNPYITAKFPPGALNSSGWVSEFLPMSAAADASKLGATNLEAKRNKQFQGHQKEHQIIQFAKNKST